MDSKDVSLTISKEIVQPIVEAKIKEALIQSFGDDSKGLIAKMIDTFLYQKVDPQGNVSRYSSENTHIYSDVILRNMINGALRDAVKSWVEDNKVTIRDAVYEKLGSKSTLKKMSGDIVSGLIEASKSKWSFKTKFEFKTDSE